MIAELKAEFRKLLSVRSTYVISLVALAFVAIATFYGTGYKRVITDPFQNLVLAGSITQIASIIGVFSGIIGLLLLTHEYRYNTITYSLTITKNRSKVMMAKILTIMAYIFVLSLVLGAIGIGLVFWGAAASGHSLPNQDINYLTFLAKIVVYSEGTALVGLLFGALIRNQVGALVTLLIFPGTVDALLGLVLKQNTVYTPFAALSQVVQPPTVNGIAATKAAAVSNLGSLTPPRGLLVFLAWLVVGWIVAWYLFLRRDAN